MIKLTSTRVRRAYYGGKNIDVMMNVDDPKNTRYPEDWLGSVTIAFNPDCVVANEGLSQSLDGQFLRDIIQKNPSDMLGPHKQMRLLFKLLDSAERLVIQGHPTISFAKENFDSEYGKTECWYILSDGGSVFLGFKKGITKEHWKKLFEMQDIQGMLDCLHEFPVKRGDMIFVAGGVPHAIGKGCFMAELQEPTDLMVIPERVTPSGITLAETKLHGGLGFEKMFDCFVYEGLDAEEVRERFFLKAKVQEDGSQLLVGPETTDFFRLEQMDVNGSHSYNTKNYGIVLVTCGQGTINGVSAKAGDRFFVPFSEKKLDCSGEFTFLFCSA